MISEKNTRRFLLTFFCLSGASALIYEVVWTRALSLLLGSTVYALSTMLSTFMAGLALGAYLGGKIADRNKNLIWYFGLLELGIALSGIFIVPAIYNLPPLYFWIYKNFHLNPAAYFVVQFVLCAMVMIIPTTLMGATFPVVSRRITRDMDSMGRMVGDAYSFNTMGAILGSLSAGFLLVPLFGMRYASLTAVGLNAVSGIALLMVSRRSGAKRAAAAALVIIGVSIFILTTLKLTTPIGTFYYAGRFENYGEMKDFSANMDELFEKDYSQGSVRALRASGLLTIQHGGKMEGTAPQDVINTMLLTTLPVAAYGKKPEDMLVIGLGAGVTTWFSKQLAPSVDVVEINPGIREAVERFGLAGTLRDVNVIIDDARRHLLLTDKQYDVITSEPSVPSEAMSANLYTREFYEIVASRLKPGGVFCQWMPAWAMTKRDTHIAAKTFGSVFPYTHLWVVLLSNDFVMLGSTEPIAADSEAILRKAVEFPLSLPQVPGHEMSREEVRKGYEMVKLIRGPEKIRELVENPDLPMMTDDLPYLEFAITKNLLLGSDFRNFRE